ncbi:MAG: hypothetical protein QM719_00425 [Thermomonas sp.]
MNVAIKSCFATLAVATVVAAASAQAATGAYINDANAPARCQAFNPGPTNTVRNRVTGSENIGAAMNVACAFENVSSFDYGTNVTEAGVQIGNNASVAFTVTCSELSGYFGDAGVVLNKTSDSIAPGGSQIVGFTADDTPDSGDTDLGSYAVGIVCNLPTHAVMGETYSIWYDEDGVEA